MIKGLTYMEQFQARVMSYGGIWRSNKVYFDVFKGCVRARYMPYYPRESKEDQTITCDAQTGIFHFLFWEKTLQVRGLFYLQKSKIKSIDKNKYKI